MGGFRLLLVLLMAATLAGFSALGTAAPADDTTPKSPDNTKAKAKAKAKDKSSKTDNTTPGSSLGPGSWIGLIKDPPSENTLLLAYHPQYTQGLPAPAAKTVPVRGKTAKARASAAAKQKAALEKDLKDDWKTLRFDIAENTPVRYFILPEAFDDKGEILKPTQAQIDQVKKGGISGKLSQMRPGMVVRVHQVKDGSTLKVDKLEVLKEVELNLPGLNGPKGAAKSQPKTKN